MEESSFTKSECFAWHDGRRIVDLHELSKQLHCKQCNAMLDLARTERETRYGLASVLYILCNCGLVNDVHTGKMQHGEDMNMSSQKPMFEVNIKASINLLMYGAGASRILSFLALLDIPMPSAEDTSLIVPVSDDAAQNSSLLASCMPTFQPQPMDMVNTSVYNSSSFVYGQDSNYSSVSRPSPFGQNLDQSDSFSADRTSKDVIGSQDYSQGSMKKEGNTKKAVRRSVEYVEDDEEDDNVVDNDGDGDDDDDEYLPPVKMKPPKKSSVKSSAKPRLKQSKRMPKIISKIKIKKISVSEKKRKEKKEKKEENQIDFSNMMEWSSTESEAEAESSQNKDSDASWKADREASKIKEEDTEVKQEGNEDITDRPKRRGRPKGSTNKLKKLPKTEGAEKDLAESEKWCGKCKKLFSTVNGYKLHLKRVHHEAIKAAREEGQIYTLMYVCHLCHYSVPRQQLMKDHLRREHDKMFILKDDPHYHEIDLNDVVKREWRTEQRWSYECKQCLQMFTNKEKLFPHLCISDQGTLSCTTMCPTGKQLSVFHGRVVFRQVHLCHFCGDSFINKARLQDHLDSGCDSGKKKYQCHIEDCNYSAKYEFFLKRHIDVFHLKKPKPRPHVCDQCGASYTHSETLRSHVFSIHNRGQKFYCPHCPKFFFTKFLVRQHANRAHKNKLINRCRFCGQGFGTKFNLRIHENIHTGEKPYKCDQCDCCFAQKNSLDIHMKKHNPVDPNTSSRKQEPVPPVPAVPDWRNMRQPAFNLEGLLPMHGPGPSHLPHHSLPPHPPHPQLPASSPPPMYKWVPNHV